MNLQDKRGEFNLIAYCVVYGFFLIGMWILPKKMGMPTWGVGTGLLMTLIMAVVTYFIVCKVFD